MSEALNALILAAYPYLIGGAALAATFCGWAAWRLRDRELKLWWLLVAIAIIMAETAVENLWFLLARIADLAEGSNWQHLITTATSPVLLFLKLTAALGAWILLYVGLAVNWERYPVGNWVRRMLLLGGGLFVITYPVVTLLILR